MIERKKIVNISFVKVIECITFILCFLFKSYADSFYNSKNIQNSFINIIKYFFLAIGFIVMMIDLMLQKKEQPLNKMRFWDNLKSIMIVVIAFSLISLIEIIITGKFTVLSIEGILYIVVAIIYAFLFINTVDKDLTYWTFVIILINSFIFYGLEIGFSNLSFKEFFLSSFLNSNSVLESSYSCGIALALCAYFSLDRRNIIISIISLIFCLFTFKRILMITGVVLFVLPIFLDTTKKPKKGFVLFSKVFFFIATIIYMWLILKPSIVSYDRMLKFTVGRSNFLINLFQNDFVPYGYYSSTDFLQNLEMDLIRIFVEMTPIGLLVFINNYMNLGKRNWYNYLFLNMIFLNLLFSHSLGTCFTWIIYYIVIYNSESFIYENKIFSSKRLVR